MSACFLSYGLGSIALNLLALVIRDADVLAITCLSCIAVSTIPCLFYLMETPKYLFKAGNVSGLMSVLYSIGRKNKKNLSRSELMCDLTNGNISVASDLTNAVINVKINNKSKNQSGDTQQSAIFELLATKKYLLQLIVMAS